MPRRSEKLRYKWTRSQRLSGTRRFDEVFKDGKRRTAHPLTIHTLRRDDQNPARVGISIGRRCGTAVRRNLIKRRLREAFRLMQYEIAPAVDYLVVVKPHEPLHVVGYQARLRQLMNSLA